MKDNNEPKYRPTFEQRPDYGKTVGELTAFYKEVISPDAKHKYSDTDLVDEPDTELYDHGCTIEEVAEAFKKNI